MSTFYYLFFVIDPHRALTGMPMPVPGRLAGVVRELHLAGLTVKIYNHAKCRSFVAGCGRELSEDEYVQIMLGAGRTGRPYRVQKLWSGGGDAPPMCGVVDVDNVTDIDVEHVELIVCAGVQMGSAVPIDTEGGRKLRITAHGGDHVQWMEVLSTLKKMQDVKIQLSPSPYDVHTGGVVPSAMVVDFGRDDDTYRLLHLLQSNRTTDERVYYVLGKDWHVDAVRTAVGYHQPIFSAHPRPYDRVHTLANIQEVVEKIRS